MSSTEYCVISGEVLAEFRDKADEPEFWAAGWQSTDYQQFLRRYEDGYLGDFDRIFKKYLPKDHAVLEAGCGRGQYVCALQQLGYQAAGIDFSDDLVRNLKKAKPGINVSVGDVRALDFANKSLGAYVSLGVVEHYWDGMQDILAEAHRALRDDGVMMLSVPHLSPMFKRRAEKIYPALGTRGHDDFYQYYFSRSKLEEELHRGGFECIDVFYYAGKYGLKRASALFDAWYEGSYLFRGVANRIFRQPVPQVVTRQFAHMILLVAIKR